MRYASDTKKPRNEVRSQCHVFIKSSMVVQLINFGLPDMHFTEQFSRNLSITHHYHKNYDATSLGVI